MLTNSENVYAPFNSLPHIPPRAPPGIGYPRAKIFDQIPHPRAMDFSQIPHPRAPISSKIKNF